MKKSFHILKIVIVAFVTLVGAALIALQSSSEQTAIADKAAATLREATSADIRFGKIHFRPFNTLIIDSLLIIDRTPFEAEGIETAPVDTFFRAASIIARFSFRGLAGGEGFHFAQVKIRDAGMNLVLEDDEKVNLMRIFGIVSDEDAPPVRNEKDIFSIRDVEIGDMAFRMFNFQSDREETRGAYLPAGAPGEKPVQKGIDWNDLDVRDINLKIKNLHFKGMVMTGQVQKMSFRERSGFVCRNLTAEARVGRGKAIVRDIRLSDGYSDLNLPLYMMSFSRPKDFSDFINLVRLDGIIGESHLDFRTLGYFAPTLPDTGLKADIHSGKVGGPVCALKMDGIKISLSDGSFAGTVNGLLSGIPDVEKMRIDGKVSACRFTAKGVDRMVNAWTEERIPFDGYAKRQSFLMDCEVSGPLNSLRIRPVIRSRTGRLEADIRFSDLVSGSRPAAMKAHLKTKGLDVGKIIGNDIVGQCSAETAVSLQFPEGRNEMFKAHIDSLKIGRLGLLGYDYTGIAAKGELSDDHFDGKLVCNDPNLSFLFQGTFALSRHTNNSLYKFYANVGHADLHALNLDRRGTSRVRFRTGANFARTGNDDILGRIDIGDIVLENGDGVQNIGDVELTSITKDDIYRVKFKSGFLDALYTGTGSPFDFIRDVKAVTVRRDLPALGDGSEPGWNGDSYDISAEFHDTRRLLSFLAPGMYMADSTGVSLKIGKDGLLDARLNSSRIAFHDKYLKELTARFSNAGDNLSGRIECGNMQIGETAFGSCALKMYADENRLGFGFLYGDSEEQTNSGELYALGELVKDAGDRLKVDVRVLPSRVRINSGVWNIRESELSLRRDAVKVSSFSIENDNQLLRVYGGLDKSAPDTLAVELERFDLSIINPLFDKDLGLRGTASGYARMVSPLDDRSILLDIISDSTAIAGRELGAVSLKCDWDRTFNRFCINGKNELDGRSSLSLDGHYTPAVKSLEAVAVLDRLDIGYASPFVNGIFDRIEGELSGKLSIDGSLSAPVISSDDARIDNGMINLLYTNVPYRVNGPVRLDRFGAHFDNVAVSDRFGASGTVNGSITYSDFNNPGLDLSVDIRGMECLNTDEKQNPYFYGQVFGSGNIRISGPFSNLQFDINAVTEKTGSLHIPIPNSTNAGTTDLLTFRKPDRFIWVDPYEEMLSSRKARKVIPNGIGVNLKVKATPGVTAFVEIDKASGNVLSARGNGLIALETDGSGFEINGNYSIDSGNYKFVALGLASRDFQIKEGSTVQFNGDIMETSLNIDALYKTKASLATLISDTTSVNTRRSVECGIRISDRLKNPRLGFSINVPDIDPTVKSKVESALSTEDKIQKQFLSLIISNSFIPDEQSGIVNSSTLLYSNASEVMSNQLNNILQKLNIPLDLGLNYQPNSKGNDVFDVAVSTQLFNNRVTVNGNIGNRQYNTGNSNSSVVGDIEIEIKLNRSGSLRMNVFSHSSDQYTNYLDNSQRNGLGLGFQMEFNGIKDEDRDKRTILKVKPEDRKKQKLTRRRKKSRRRNDVSGE